MWGQSEVGAIFPVCHRARAALLFPGVRVGLMGEVGTRGSGVGIVWGRLSPGVVLAAEGQLGQSHGLVGEGLRCQHGEGVTWRKTNMDTCQIRMPGGTPMTTMSLFS